MSPQGTTSKSYPTMKASGISVVELEKLQMLQLYAEAGVKTKAGPTYRFGANLFPFMLEEKEGGGFDLVGPPMTYLKSMKQERLIYLVQDFNSTMMMGKFLRLYGIEIDREQVRDLDSAIQFILNYIYGDKAISYKGYVEEQLSKLKDFMTRGYEQATK